MVATISKGILTGLILSLPFGPIGIYCMEKTVIESQKNGYISALGMVTVDVIYSVLALFAISHMDDSFYRYEIFLQFLVSVFLIYLGWKKIEKKVEIRSIECTPVGMIKDYFTTFFLSLANISSIFSIFIILTTLRAYSDDMPTPAPYVAIGVFVGGATEWFITTYVLSHFTRSVNEDRLIKISQIAGGLIFICGLASLALCFIRIFR